MTTSGKCSDSSSLERLLDGSLAEGDQAALAAHLELCPRCQSEIERLAAGTATWDALANQLRVGNKPVSPVLAAAIESLKTQARGSDEPVLAQISPDLPPGFLGPPREPGHLGQLGDYDVIEEVGRGAMGIVLRAFDERLRRSVAIKVMSPQLANFPLSRQRFIREARAAAAVCHEHVVTLYAVSEASGLPFLVMEFLGGATLQDRLDRTGPLKVSEILRIGMQAAAGLAAAHAQGLVHRDIKPANLLLENGIERVKLTDFGLARAVDDATLTQTGIITGTPQFMSPEQARGEQLDHRVDLFSLGCVLYAIATGRPPFRAPTTLAVLKRICEDQPRPIRELNPEIPEWLAAIVMKLLAKQPDERFQSAAELSELLGQCLAHVQQPERAPLPAAACGLPNRSANNERILPRARQGSKVWLIVLTVVLGLLLMTCALPAVALLAWFFHGTGGPPVSQGIQQGPWRDPDPGTRKVASAAELAELDRLVGIAQEQWRIAEARHAEGRIPTDEALNVQIEFVQAKVRHAQAADNREEAVALLKELVALWQQLVDLAGQSYEAGRGTQSTVLDAKRGLSEARLELKQAEETLAVSR